MANLLEIATIQTDNEWNNFLNKVRGAVIIKAAAVINEPTPDANQLAWAKSAISGPSRAAQNIVGYLVGTRNTFTVSGILGASDSSIQNNVDAAVVALYS